MVGPKLDARSYTILILAAVVTVLSVNIFAQRTTRSDAGDTVNFNESAAVASANRDIASANREIASAITQLADAVAKLKLEVNVAGDGTAAAAAPPASAAAAPAEREIDPNERLIPEGGGITFN